MKASAPFEFRYQYLAGGVNTGDGWANWNSSGQFATYYIQDSVANGMTPVFTYYMIAQSAPGNSQGESGIFTNLSNTSTMTAYWNDLKLFFQRAGATNTPVVLHVEPDLWGFVQQRASNDNAASVAAKVGSTGLSELSGVPDNMSGFATAVKRLRDQYAPKVILGYHVSVWGTGNDIYLSNPSSSTVDTLATRAANFYKSLGTDFDIAFAEFSDRDAGFKQHVYGDGGASWWDAADFDRSVRFITKFVDVARERVVMWQIPLGNTKMRAMNNTWNHYQDNRVEWLLDDPSRSHLQAYVDAGVVAFLFGRGADGATCACDGNGDGVTNPSPINGNTLTSLNSDDDGGFFRQKAAAYYSAGAMALGAGTGPVVTPTKTATTAPTRTPTKVATATRTPTSVATPTRTSTVAPTSTPPVTAGWTSSATVSPATVRPGATERIQVSVRSGTTTRALVDLEVYDPAGRKVYQTFADNQSFTAGSSRSFTVSWRVPSNAARGTYTVKVGVFSPGWGSVFSWNNQAATFTVR